MIDKQMITSIIRQQSMSYQRILEVYQFLFMLAQDFRAKSRLLQCLIYF